MERMQTTWDEVAMSGHIVELAKKLGLPDSFFSDLRKESDWSFIVKLHALIEAAVTQLLCYHFAEPRLIEIFSNLEMSNSKTGKIAFLKDTGLLGEEFRKYIIELSQLRNKFVHNVSFSVKSISEIISGYSQDQLKSFALRFSPSDAITIKMQKSPFGKSFEIEKPDVDRLVARAVADPKMHIWIGAYTLFTTLSDMYGLSDYEQYQKAIKHLDDSESDEDGGV